MVTLFEMIISSWWLVFISSRFSHLIYIKKGSGTKQLEQRKHLSAKIQEVISSIVITEKNEKLCQATGILGTQGVFSDRVTPDKLVVQCGVQAVENTFIDDSK